MIVLAIVFLCCVFGCFAVVFLVLAKDVFENIVDAYKFHFLTGILYSVILAFIAGGALLILLRLILFTKELADESFI